MSDSERFIDDQRATGPLLESEVHSQSDGRRRYRYVITINWENTILQVNPTAERFSIEEMLGQPLNMLMPEYLRHLHRAGVARYLEAGQRHIEWAAV